MSELRNFINSMLEPIRERILMNISKAVIERVERDTGIQLAKVSLLAGESRDNLELIQHFGFTSSPPPNSEAVAAFIGGNREHGAIIGSEHRSSRPKLEQDGESAVYTIDGTKIYLKKGGEILIQTAAKVTVETLEVQMTGNLTVAGDVQIDGSLNVDGDGDFGGDVSAINVSATGSVSAGGAVTGATVSAGGTSLASIKSAFNGHTHPPGATDPPSSSIP